jgi:hypothetical protein
LSEDQGRAPQGARLLFARIVGSTDQDCDRQTNASFDSFDSYVASGSTTVVPSRGKSSLDFESDADVDAWLIGELPPARGR